MASVIEKNITDLFTGLRRGMTTSSRAANIGLLQSLDPRTKIICALVFIILSGWCPSVLLISLFYFFFVLLALLSHIPLRRMMRLWIVLPFFSLFLAVPLLFSFVVPGIPLFFLPGPWHISVTHEGVFLAIRMLLRVVTAMSIVQLVLETTRWDYVLRGFELFKIPHTILFVFALTYRYIFILLSTALDMMFARKSRNVGKVTASGSRFWIGTMTGCLLVKSFVMSANVHDAMISRGFTGEVRTMYPFVLHVADYVCFLSTIIIMLVSIKLSFV
jgi:cobalt/nickel transport system permease protein